MVLDEFEIRLSDLFDGTHGEYGERIGWYGSPEGGGDWKSQVYSLGKILEEMSTLGTLKNFEKTETGELITRMMSQNPLLRPTPENILSSIQP
jgi:hypothetical protein